MDSFDKIIKEKVEQKQYEYKPVFWKRFAKQAGFSLPYSGIRIALVSVLSAGLLSLGGFWLYRILSSDTKPVEVVEPAQVDQVQVVTDTVLSPAEEPIAAVPSQQTSSQEDPSQRLEAKPAPVKKENSAKSAAAVQPDTSATKVPAMKPKPVRKEKVRERRILIIDPDTIRSNY